MKLLSLCEDIMQLCHNGYEPNWEKTFRYFVEEIKAGNAIEIKREIQNIYTGMGSFNDLILQKDGELLSLNNRLDTLRQMLYQEITR
ncbi:DUF6966 domain-containing protein [Polluticoccus soli]|uniref:DUF6966 domain-containing protein n=1 Tax=Polluticoccus soli TaxID=3034150 RepID=UPI0023E2F53C|nr:hypothetical protein [Flavipsychrobacter sp. JY13-12]